MASIRLEGISRQFGSVPVLRDVSLEIGDGEFIVLLGPSGCGKSTLLRIIAGLEQPDTGSVRVGERDVTSVDPSDRDLAFVFQSYALYPHKTVRENIVFPLRMRLPWPGRVPLVGWLSPSRGRIEAELTRRAREVAEPLGLIDLLDRKPVQLSGGQRQRVALARALVRQPAAFLLDEPLSNLDAKLRSSMRAELVELHRLTGTTFVYVTHDQSEAMSMADRVVVLHDGVVEQAGPPLSLYDNPATRFVAELVGTPLINVWPLIVGDDGRVAMAGLTAVAPASIDGVRLQPGMHVDMACRPHSLSIGPDTSSDLRAMVVYMIEPHGDVTFVTLRPRGAGSSRTRLVTRVSAEIGRRLTIGEAVSLQIDWGRVLLFDRDGRRLRATAVERAA